MDIRSTARSLGVMLAAIAGVIVLGWSGTMTTVAQLLATTSFIMGGTQHPLVNPDPSGRYEFATGIYSYPTVEEPLTTDYVNGAQSRYIAVAYPDPDGYNKVATWTPAEFWPTYGSLTFDDSVAKGVANLDNCVQGRSSCIAHIYPDGVGPASNYVVFGYSQSARVATVEKRNLISKYRNPDGSWKPIEDSTGQPFTLAFFLIANPNRPNGGILERLSFLPTIPILEISFDGATPTDSCDSTGVCHFPTTDVTRQYDGWSDFPVYPLNILAVANAIAGISLLHGDYFSNSVSPALYQGEMGDTTYYMSPTARLPILMPLAQIPFLDPVLAAFDAPLRVIIEWGYARETSPGEPTRAKLIRLENPITDVVNLAVAIPTGWDDGIQEVGLGRPFGTTPAGPYGVGGPDLPSAPPGTPASIPAAPTPLAAAQFAADADTNPAPAESKVTTLSEKLSLATNSETGASTRVVTRPQPLRDILRGPIEANLPKPKVVRPSGDRPLKKVLDALTGQRPKADAGGPENKDAAA